MSNAWHAGQVVAGLHERASGPQSPLASATSDGASVVVDGKRFDAHGDVLRAVERIAADVAPRETPPAAYRRDVTGRTRLLWCLSCYRFTDGTYAYPSGGLCGPGCEKNCEDRPGSGKARES